MKHNSDGDTTTSPDFYDLAEWVNRTAMRALDELGEFDIRPSERRSVGLALAALLEGTILGAGPMDADSQERLDHIRATAAAKSMKAISDLD